MNTAQCQPISFDSLSAGLARVCPALGRNGPDWPCESCNHPKKAAPLLTVVRQLLDYPPPDVPSQLAP